MPKRYHFTILQEEDPEWGEGYSRYEELKDEDGKVLYSVCNLTDCPEDAIITRNLVPARDIVGYIEFGMELARKGYAGVSVDYGKMVW